MRLRFLLALAVFVLISHTSAHADTFSTTCSYTTFTTATDDSAPSLPGLSNGQGADSGAIFGGISNCGAASGVSASVDGTRTYSSFDSQGNPQDAVFLQSGRATASGSVSPGHISLSATGTATSSPGEAPVGSPFARLNFERATAQGNASGSYTDYLTIVGSPGTQVTLGFTSSFAGSFTTGGTAGFYNLEIFPCSGEPIACHPVTQFGPLGSIDLSAPGLQTVDISGFTFDTFEIVARAGISAFACAGGACVGLGAGQPGGYTFIESDSQSADALHTAALSIVDLTPGTSFTTTSGFDYAPQPPSTVPEPSSLVYLLTGLGGLGSMTLRKLAKI